MREDRPRVHAETREAWREWLAEHHDRESGAWLVSWRPATGRPAGGYEEAVGEALCFGWVDSTARRLDDERTALYFAPRKPRSGWSRSNKQRVARLRAEGRMAPAGERAVARAEENGSWTLLDEVEDLVEPADLRAALDAAPGAWDHWRGFPPSARRALLEWVVQARTAPTRERRVTEIARAAALGERAHQGRRADPPSAR